MVTMGSNGTHFTLKVISDVLTFICHRQLWFIGKPLGHVRNFWFAICAAVFEKTHFFKKWVFAPKLPYPLSDQRHLGVVSTRNKPEMLQWKQFYSGVPPKAKCKNGARVLFCEYSPKIQILTSSIF